MLYRFVRVFWAVLFAAMVWWIGPLISIGVYRPFGWVFFRQCLAMALLIWGFWPWLVMAWGKLGMGVRQLQAAPTPVQGTDALTGRLKDLDRQLKVKWLRQTRSKWLQGVGLIFNAHRQSLPWYLVMGPEGSGKTSWVAQLPSQGAAFQKTDADVNFWITQTAVWFDTPGSWMARKGMSDNDQHSWHQLLQSLRHVRKARDVVNGLVLCLDIVTLLQEPLEERKRLADSIRERLIDAQETWGQTPHVYLALTGLDKVAGASEFLSSMNVQQLSCGLGFALPLASDDAAGDGGVASEAVWRQAFLEMETRVHTRVLYNAAQDTTQKSGGQLPFVEALASLKSPLFDFLQIALGGLDRHPHAELRGVWLGSMNGATHGVDSDAKSEGDTAQQNFSALWTPIQQQIYLEQSNKGRSGPVVGRQRVITHVRQASLVAVTTLVAIWLAWGYWAEMNHLEDVSAQFTEAKRLAVLQSGQGQDAVAPLLEVASQMRYALAQLEGTERFLPTPYFEHSKIEAVAAATYHRHLHKTLMPELHNQVKKILQTQTKTGRGDVYQTLKIYLMLARPERRSATELEQWINANWLTLSAGARSSDEDRMVLLSHARALFTQAQIPGTPEDASIIKEARARAAETPSVTRVLQHLQNQGLPASSPDVSLSRAAGLASAMALRLRSNAPSTEPTIPGWYTRSGYTDVVLPRLTVSSRSILEEEGWVLRDEPFTGNSFEMDKTVEKLSDAARSQFLQDYIRRWRQFLSDVAPRHVSGLDDAAQIASLFVDPQSPLALLVRFAARETTLTGNYEGDLDSWIDRQKVKIEKGRRAIVGEIAGEHYRTKLLPEHVVEDQFDPLRRFALQMNQSQSSAASNPLSRLFEPLSTQLGIVNGAMLSGQIMPEFDAFTRLRNEAGRQPEPVRGVMLDLINSGSAMTTKQSGAMLSRSAAGATKVVCDQGLTSRYPFSRSSTTDVGVQDFERLFGPQGLMAAHFRDQLAPYVDTSSTPWRTRSADPSHANFISPEVLRSYETAERIRAATLDQAGQLRMAATVRFVDMDSQIAESQLEISGQMFRYAHGSSASRRIDWQTQGSQLTVALHVRGVDGRTDVIRFDGPWALLRFFDAGKTQGGSNDRRDTFHHSRLGRVHLEWQAVSTPSPIWSELFTTFRCPR
jgi:type VI secretion system protein ImpL